MELDLEKMHSLLGEKYIYKNSHKSPGQYGSVGWSVIPYSKMLQVQFPIRAHTQAVVQTQVQACCTLPTNHCFSLTLKFLSLFLSLKAIKKMSSCDYEKNSHRISFGGKVLFLEKYFLTLNDETRDLLTYYTPFILVLHVNFICQGKIISLIAWAGNSVAQNIIPKHQGCKFGPQSGDTLEATNKHINKWNNKLTFLSPLFCLLFLFSSSSFFIFFLSLFLSQINQSINTLENNLSK